jgi:processive 1,2-diacylglycerol beta-glucosyltransferase
VKSIKRFLIFYLSIGSGHLSAANALKKGIRLLGNDHKVFCEDLFTPAIRDSVIPEFLSLSSTLFFPGVYDSAWQSGSMKSGYEFLQTMPLLRNRVLELLSQRNPDMVICTHSLPCSILASLRSERVDIPPIVAVNTDLMAHPYWPIEGVNGFVVATQEAENRLLTRGVDGKKIRVFGIPIDPVAESLSSQKAVTGNIRKVNAPLNVLILAGGKRLAPYVTTWPRTISLLSESAKLPSSRIHWNVVCGSPSAFSQLLADTTKGRDDVTLFSYVTNFLELLNQQDYVITKPGGLILAEALALGVPVILVSRGSGQEAANSEIVLSHRCGIMAESEKDVLDYLQDVLNYPYIYNDAKGSAQAFGKPAAAIRAAEWLLNGMLLT